MQLQGDSQLLNFTQAPTDAVPRVPVQAAPSCPQHPSTFHPMTQTIPKAHRPKNK